MIVLILVLMLVMWCCVLPQVNQLHAMLKGPLHSLVDVTLARHGLGAHFTIRVQRHRFFEASEIQASSTLRSVESPGSTQSSPRTLV